MGFRGIGVSPPFYGVLAVLFLCSCFEVQGVDAYGVVAFVSYDWWLLVVRYVEREPVRRPCFVLI